jgi:hypothetical protein
VVPVGNRLDEFGAKAHAATPNVEVTGLARLYRAASPAPQGWAPRQL